MKKTFPIAKPAASACLCGHKVRYDGGDCAVQNALPEQILPICPEVMGGLPTPRAPAEIVGGDGHDVWAGSARVLDAHGVDVTEAFKQGAILALQRLQAVHIDTVYLKSKSPSCGQGQIYDGSFSGQLREGDGVSTALFKQHGICVISL
jgi:uncharacterized protein YbbK (DUF523 family)